MYCLYLLLKDRDEPVTEEEMDIAAGKKTIDPAQAADYLVKLEKASTSIVNLFNQQHQATTVWFLHWRMQSYSLLLLQEQNWDQGHFEQLLANWVVVCDQPFDEVEKPEFRQLLKYTHLRPSLHIPHRATMKKRIMKMGEDTVEGVKKMIQVSVPHILNVSHAYTDAFDRNLIVKSPCPLTRGLQATGTGFWQ